MEKIKRKLIPILLATLLVISVFSVISTPVFAGEEETYTLTVPEPEGYEEIMVDDTWYNETAEWPIVEEFDDGTVVDLNATAAEGWLFDEWVISNETDEWIIEDADTTVTMDENLTAQAYFILEDPFFEVAITDYSPEEVAGGDELVVDYEVTNIGAEEGTQNITFTVMGMDPVALGFELVEMYVEENVTIDAGDTYTGNFTHTHTSTYLAHHLFMVESEDDADDFMLEIFYVLGVVSAQEDEYIVGDNVTLEYSVTNTGDIEGTEWVLWEHFDFWFEFTHIRDDEMVTAAPGESVESTLVWETDEDDYGDYGAPDNMVYNWVSLLTGPPDQIILTYNFYAAFEVLGYFDLTIEEPIGEGDVYIDGDLVEEYPYTIEDQLTGEEFRVRAEPADGWEFDSWTGSLFTFTREFTVVMPYSDMTLQAVFEEAPEPEPPEFEWIDDLAVDGETDELEIELEEDEEEEVDITGELENVGEETGEITLEVNGDKINSWEVEGGDTVEIDESYVFDEEGTYDVTLTGDYVDDQTVTVVVEVEEEEEVPGFTATLLLLAAVFAVALYKKKQ